MILEILLRVSVHAAAASAIHITFSDLANSMAFELGLCLIAAGIGVVVELLIAHVLRNRRKKK